MLRAGEPDARVAVYLPTEDAFAALSPPHASANDLLGKRLDPTLVGQLLDAGQPFDFVDGGAVASGRLRHRLLVLPRLTRIAPAAYAAILAWARAGGVVIATGALPGRAGGRQDGMTGTRAVQAISRRLQGLGAGRVRVVAPDAVGAAVATALVPMVRPAAPTPQLGFVRRRLNGGVLYFLVNTLATRLRAVVRFDGDNGRGQWWNPVDGRAWAAGSGAIPVDLAPYESRMLVFLDGAAPVAPRADTVLHPVDRWSGPWRATTAAGLPAPPPGRSWTEAPALRGYSGSVTYVRDLTLPHGESRPGARFLLDLGADRPVAAGSAERPVAALLAPVRDAAIVRVNGRDAAIVWAPPWQADVTGVLHPGRNRVEVRVMNGALNALAAAGRPDRRLLTARYGERFVDQDADKVTAQPSGLLGRVTLLATDGDVPASAPAPAATAWRGCRRRCGGHRFR